MIHLLKDARRPIRLARAAVAALLIALLLEFLLANAQRLFVYSDTDYPAVDPEPYCMIPETDGGGYLLAPTKALNYEKLPCGIFSVTFDIRYQNEDFIASVPAPTVKVTASDPRTSWQSDGFITVISAPIAIGEGGVSETVTLYASVRSTVTEKLRISFTGLEDSVFIENVRINEPPRWTLSPLRTLLIALLIFLPAALSITGLRFTPYDPSNLRHRLGVRSAVLVTVLFSLVFLSLFLNAGEEIPYPLTGAVRYYQPYVQQFDAFMKGQLHLDVPVSDEMLGLENPYDYNDRVHANPLWDRAYYDGKYYSYFGLTPVLLVYFPYYLMTGALPSDRLVMAIFLLLTAVFLPLTVIKWAELHEKKRLPLPFLYVGAVSAFLGSMMLLIARSVAPFYYIATLAGNAFLSLFLFLLLKAAEAARLRVRCAFYVLAGIAYGLLLHSRLNIALLAAFVVLPYLVFRVLKRRAPEPAAPAKVGDCAPETQAAEETAAETECSAEEPTRAAASLPGRLRTLFARLLRQAECPRPLLLSLLSLGTPVALALGAALLLNHLRFGSPFEFGTTYQLTVSDVSYNTVSLGNLAPAIFHYFFQSPELSPVFPYLSLTRLSTGDYGHYVYIDTGLSLLSLPLMKGLLLSPAVLVFKKRTVYEKALLVSVLIGLVVLALLNFSLGGVIFRYTADMTSLAALASVLVVFALYSAVSEGAYEKGTDGHTSAVQRERAAYVILTLFLLVSVAAALLLTLSANGNLSKYPASTLVMLRDFFTFR